MNSLTLSGSRLPRSHEEGYLVSISVGADPSRTVPASSLTGIESLTREVPSVRQNTSESSVSTRLHVGQRFIRLFRQVQASQHFLEALIVAERIPKCIDLQPMQVEVVVCKRIFKFGKGFVLITKRGINTGNPIGNHILRFGDVLESFDNFLCVVAATGLRVSVADGMKRKLAQRVGLQCFFIYCYGFRVHSFSDIGVTNVPACRNKIPIDFISFLTLL